MSLKRFRVSRGKTEIKKVKKFKALGRMQILNTSIWNFRRKE